MHTEIPGGVEYFAELRRASALGYVELLVGERAGFLACGLKYWVLVPWDWDLGSWKSPKTMLMVC
jgi:hypothetical protein